MYRIFICLFALLLASCAKNEKSKENHYPDNAYIYGEGYGSSYELAKQAAIKDITTALQVNVRYSDISSITQDNNSLSTSGMSNVYLDSNIKNLSNVEVVESQENKDGFKVRARINKIIMQSQLIESIYKEEHQMDNMIKTCGMPSLRDFNKMKTIFTTYQNDILLYNALSKLPLESENAKYQSMLNNPPSYELRFFFNTRSSHNKDIESIITPEIGRFVSINPDSNIHIDVNVEYRQNIEIIIKVYDCNNSIILQIPINTYINTANYDNNRQRLGPIVYKRILDELNKGL